MEKRLRAARVNIIPRNGGYFSEPTIPPPVSKQPPPIPSPEAVEKATNPVALRYWNQCMDKTAAIEINETTSPMMKRRNNNQEVEVVKVLSSAGIGIKRENEVKEALGNINRFFTVDKMKMDDAERVSRSKTRKNFQNMSANCIPKSPKPFRRGLSETKFTNT